MPSSTRSNKETPLLFSSDHASLERLIHKERRSSSIHNYTSSSIDTLQPPSTQTPISSTDTRQPPSTEATLSSTDIFHPTSIDTSSRTSIDTEPRDIVATLVLVRDENGDLHYQECHLRNAASQRIDAQGAEDVNFISETGFQRSRNQNGNGNFYGNGQTSNFNQSSQYQKPYSQNYSTNNSRSYGNSSYQKPPPQTQESKIEAMLDRKHESSDKSSKRVATQQPNTCSARSLRSDRARAKKLGRYISTELEQELGRYHEKLQEGDFEVESLMSFGGSYWCRSKSDFEHRSTDFNQNRSTSFPEHGLITPTESVASCNAVRITTHNEFAASHPHPPSPFHVNIDRKTDLAIDRQRVTTTDRQPPEPIDRRAPLTFRVQLPKIDIAQINALRPQPKPSANPPENTSTHSEDAS
ncbi:hypothetical protein F2Q70_00029860 [Brassica cretica]|uniref:Uncharacterized protein n=1 Tax=Brassica cretica TaxID=69181 RepID=A0A8S9FC31_BRACR|nr:hypothetical protein F2Q70_00029860 [Brassica cretica]